VNPLLTKSGRARPSFKAILHLSSLSALRLSFLATVPGEGGVLLFLFVELEERVDAKDTVVEEGVGARLEGRRVWGVGFSAAAGYGFEVVDRRNRIQLVGGRRQNVHHFLRLWRLGERVQPFFRWSDRCEPVSIFLVKDCGGWGRRGGKELLVILCSSWTRNRRVETRLFNGGGRTSLQIV
jgi:hypothetical protein